MARFQIDRSYLFHIFISDTKTSFSDSKLEFSSPWRNHQALWAKVNQNGNDQGAHVKMPTDRLHGPSDTKFCSVWF